MSGPVNVVIVGGGTAGWMAAVGLSRLLPKRRLNIQLIESEEIGIVGVGEATLPHMKQFNDSVGIDEAEMMRRTNGTFKLGIEFVDWGFKGSSYIHPFGIHGRPGQSVSFHHQWVRANQQGHESDLEQFSFAIVASRRNRFDFPATKRETLGSSYSYAYHFDAGQYSKFLRELAEESGVRRTEGKIERVTRAENGDIASVVLESGQSIEGDLFIDCSGFRSLLLGSELGVGWEDWGKWLPCDRAFAVPCERTGDLLPYTRSTALEGGWQWRIPLQHRTGNGYVFSTGFISEDEAAARLIGNLDGAALGDPRLLRFRAGRRAKSWTSNCIALGLASGFLEPLESTSIYLVQTALMHLLPLFPDKHIDPVLADEFNRRIDNEYERIRDFLILHYHLNQREDSELWRYCRSMDVPDSLTRKMEIMKSAGFIEEYRDGLFTPPSWLSVFVGQGLIPTGYHPMAENMPLDEVVLDLKDLREEIADRVDEMPKHAAFVESYCLSDQGRQISQSGLS